MQSTLENELRSLASGAEIRFSLAQMPLEELLLIVHEARFTGAVEVGEPPAMDRVFFRDGVVVGVVAPVITELPPGQTATDVSRRLLFALYDRGPVSVRVAEGLDRLSNFEPVYIDVRPAIAFGLVVRASAENKQRIAALAANKRVRTVAPYDEKRNSYGLPPPAMKAMALLAEDFKFDAIPVLPGLTPDTTAGLLLLLERMSLLRVEAS